MWMVLADLVDQGCPSPPAPPLTHAQQRDRLLQQLQLQRPLRPQVAEPEWELSSSVAQSVIADVDEPEWGL